MVVVYAGKANVVDHALWLEPVVGDDEDPFEVSPMDDPDGVFAGQTQGLLGASIPNGLGLITGLQSGYVGLKVAIRDVAPKVGSAWQDVSEVSLTQAYQQLRLFNNDGDQIAIFELPSGEYRVRYSCAGMDQAAEIDMNLDDPVDTYLLEFWPAPVATDRIRRQSSEQAEYWRLAHSNEVPEPSVDVDLAALSMPLDYDAPIPLDNPPSRFVAYQRAAPVGPQLWDQSYKSQLERPLSGAGRFTVIPFLCGDPYPKFMMFCGDPCVWPSKEARRKTNQGKAALAKSVPDLTAMWMSTGPRGHAVVDLVVSESAPDPAQLDIAADSDVFTVAFEATGTELYLEGDCWQPGLEDSPATLAMTGLQPGSYELFVVASGRDQLRERLTTYLYPKAAPAYTVVQCGSIFAQHIAEPTADAPPAGAAAYPISYWFYLCGYRSALPLPRRLQPDEAFAQWVPHELVRDDTIARAFFGADPNYGPSGVGGHASIYPGVIGVSVINRSEAPMAFDVVSRSAAPVSIDEGLGRLDNALLLSTWAQDGALDLFDAAGHLVTQLDVGDEGNIGLRVVFKNEEGFERLSESRKRSGTGTLCPAWVRLEWWPIAGDEVLPTEVREVSEHAQLVAAINDQSLYQARRWHGQSTVDSWSPEFRVSSADPTEER